MEAKQLDEIVDYLLNELGGDWLLTGGSLVRLSFDANRGTQDVDLVRISHPRLSDEATRNELFQWLIKRGLGPEWVNTAVEPFVKAIPSWEKELVLERTGTQGRIFRPSFTFFVYLKLGRGTEVDIEDIRAALPHCKEGFNAEKFDLWATPALKKSLSSLRSKIDF